MKGFNLLFSIYREEKKNNKLNKMNSVLKMDIFISFTFNATKICLKYLRAKDSLKKNWWRC
jgi:hypothetical protein